MNLLGKKISYQFLFFFFCRLSCYHYKTPQLATIFELKQAIHSGKDLNCIKLSKNWYNTFFFQEDLSMDLASRMIWKFGRPMKLHTSSFSVKSQSAVLHFHHSTNFARDTKETNFSVKSSWKIHWIIMFQKDAVCWGSEILDHYAIQLYLRHHRSI